MQHRYFDKLSLFSSLSQKLNQFPCMCFFQDRQAEQSGKTNQFESRYLSPGLQQISNIKQTTVLKKYNYEMK